MHLTFPFFARLFLCATFLETSWAHPGEDHDHIKREAEVLSEYSRRALTSMSKCSDSTAAQLQKRHNLARRHATATALRKERGIKEPLLERDLAALQSFEAISHDETGLISSQDPTILFGANTSCILAPEVTIGPYYVLGELVRSNLTEGEPGVPMHLEVQFINTNNCEPVENLLVDIWNVNSTGTYSGIASEAGLNTTYLRGLQQSSSEGVVQFDSIFPGHYTGRTIHTHLAVQTNATLLPNGSYTAGTFSHVGQLFYTESLSAKIAALSPYNKSTVTRMTNVQDTIAQTQADNNNDPFVQYVLLNPNNILDGIFAWIEIGIDPAANHTSDAPWAAVWAADGGHANPNGMAGGPDGKPNGSNGTTNGTAPGSTASRSSSSGSAVTALSSSGANSMVKWNPLAMLRAFG